ncbi:hypothetical protein NDU88_001864 [Pleurodeles waltl]|uniref:Uncharacterized protein n=1 Tax=Pleurodeles waltl TaxID=8319 RepID=A0AAV7U9N4_PLEWA|nr:hypothetical protein NDU88_001864 [Pleurodeles waltl]
MAAENPKGRRARKSLLNRRAAEALEDTRQQGPQGPRGTRHDPAANQALAHTLAPGTAHSPGAAAVLLTALPQKRLRAEADFRPARAPPDHSARLGRFRGTRITTGAPGEAPPSPPSPQPPAGLTKNEEMARGPAEPHSVSAILPGVQATPTVET